jgi:hypothetical protein
LPEKANLTGRSEAKVRPVSFFNWHTMLKHYANNPHYFEYRGKPIMLAGSGEHYGAVINTKFDYRVYLDTLAKDGLNQTRAFSGTYWELPGEFGIEDNTLAPAEADVLCPWVKNDAGLYDLTRWNDAYFARLKDYAALAQEKGVLIEYVVFCFWYNDALWRNSPMHPTRNAQGVGPLDKEQVYTLDSPLLPHMEAFVRKVVIALNAFDNIYYEVTNEPYSRHDHTDYRAWQSWVAGVIEATETGLPNKHLIALNIHNRGMLVESLPAGVGIVNFHYTQPEAALMNRHLNLPVVDDETGFIGQRAAPYRKEAWRFLMAGGAGFSHLDYGFTVAHPDGSAQVTGSTPGYGGTDLRDQLAFLKRLLEEIEVWRMNPQPALLAWDSGPVPASALADAGRCCAVYWSDVGDTERAGISLPAGEYELRWLDPVACETISTQRTTHAGGHLFCALPANRQELALAIWNV